MMRQFKNDMPFTITVQLPTGSKVVKPGETIYWNSPEPTPIRYRFVILNLSNALKCADCGSVIAGGGLGNPDIEAHDRFHEKIDNSLSDLYPAMPRGCQV